MAEATIECVVCGIKYRACTDCQKYQSWRAKCDTMQHWQVYQIIVMFTRGDITAQEAADKLSYLGIAQGDTKQFTEPNAQILDEIFFSLQHTSNKKDQAIQKKSDGIEKSTER